MKFGDKLRDYRLSKGYKQDDLANLIGLPRSTISELENGRRKVSLRTIKVIAEKTGTNISDWIIEDANTEVELFDGLKIVLEALIDTKKIDENGNMNDEAKGLAMKMLEKEVKLMVIKRKS